MTPHQHLLLLLLLLLVLQTSTEAFSPPPPSSAIGRTSSLSSSFSSLPFSSSSSTTTVDDDAIDVDVDLLVIGGGISGLAASITAAESYASKTTTTVTRQSSSSSRPTPSILILETSDDLGGRVRTDVTDDGYVLDRGFAVFVEDYPTSRKLLDYDALDLRRFEPGALVRMRRDDNDGDGDGKYYFAKLSDPLMRPRNALTTLFSPICGPMDKMKLIPLFLTVFTKSVEELFDMDETDARTCLTKTYGLSDDFVNSSLAPFVEGIYLTSLENISSRMLHFVLKMFAGGYASLPRGGMRTMIYQMRDRALSLGIDVRYGSRATSLMVVASSSSTEDEENDEIVVSSCEGGGYVVGFDTREHDGTMTSRTVRARTVVIATDVDAANTLLMGTNGLVGGSSGGRSTAEDGSSLSSLPPRRSVGCLYYGFASPSPVFDPILILNGEGGRDLSKRKEYPINNVCFPSRVHRDHAPDGYELCCVSILEDALEKHGNDLDSLDVSVRVQLATWFPEYASDILDEAEWVRKGSYVIDNAQPANYHRGGGVDDEIVAGYANVHGGRDCSTFRGIALPEGIYVCGDHMATSTLNGALESGVNAGDTVARFVLSG